VARRRYLLQTRSTDLDWLGHVNNVVYGEYLQEARVDLITQWRGALDTHAELSMVVAKQEIVYVRPLHFRPQPVAVDSWIEHVGTTSYTFAQEVREPEGDVLYARGSCVIVQMDKATERSSPLSQELRAHLLTFGDDGLPSS
jgi:acyl-CoA thioester hydrolase